MHVEGSKRLDCQLPPTEEQLARAAYWIRYIHANLDTLLKKEKEQIDKYGIYYDRDSDRPYLRPVNKDEDNGN